MGYFESSDRLTWLTMYAVNPMWMPKHVLLSDPRLHHVREAVKNCRSLDITRDSTDELYAHGVVATVFASSLSKFPNITAFLHPSALKCRVETTEIPYCEYTPNVRTGPTRFAVFVASHISYDKQINYLRNCIRSILVQTEPVDLYVSISSEPKYTSAVRELRGDFKMLPVQILIRDEQTPQMIHIKLLHEQFGGRHDRIMFCDDDDTYEPQRVQVFRIRLDCLKGPKEMVSRVILVEAESEKNLNTAEEFWRCAVAPSTLTDFYGRFHTEKHISYLKSPYADMILRWFLRSDKWYSRAIIIYPVSLYNYREHGDSVCGDPYRHIKTETDSIVMASIVREKSLHEYDSWLFSFKKERVIEFMRFLYIDILSHEPIFDLCSRALNTPSEWPYDRYITECRKHGSGKATDPDPHFQFPGVEHVNQEDALNELDKICEDFVYRSPLANV